MKTAAITLLFCCITARADGPGRVIDTSPGVVFGGLFQGASCTPLIPDDASTIFHLYVCGGSVLDTKGNVITEVGSVPRVGSTSMGFPNGKSAEGIGPFSTTQYFTLPSGLFNFNTHLWVTVVVRIPASQITTRRQVLGSVSGSGSNFQGFAAASFTAPTGTQYRSQLITYNNDNGNGYGGINFNNNTIAILSQGQEGSDVFSKGNTSATITTLGSATAYASFTGIPRVGNTVVTPIAGGTNSPYNGVIFEIRVTRTAPTVAGLDALHTAIRNNP